MPHYRRLLVTGGSGFIGSAFIRRYLKDCEKIVNLDLLTYAGDPERLNSIEQSSHYRFVQGTICDRELVASICLEEEIDAVVHFAAESHVDRSISNPSHFMMTNIIGTFSLLEVIKSMPSIHFHHVSTDEVYGSLSDVGVFLENSPYQPNSPYAASKASSDHLVRAYAHTYGLSTTISHCSNNYGPFQHPEKLIPLVIAHCLEQKPIPIYGEGDQIRDWLHVDDHVDALWLILQKGRRGEVYNIGGVAECRNKVLIKKIIDILSSTTGVDYSSLITHVADRPGHDYRYAIDSSKIKSELSWAPAYPLEEGLRKTIEWTLATHFDKIAAYVGN